MGGTDLFAFQGRGKALCKIFLCLNFQDRATPHTAEGELLGRAGRNDLLGKGVHPLQECHFHAVGSGAVC